MNRALHKLPFKMLMQKRIFRCVRPLDLFAAIDLKDAYFHVSILLRHRPFLQFAFEGRAYQYKPFGLSLSPSVFTKVVEAALVPLREQGVHILNYLDDWLILTQSSKRLCAHRDLVLKHLSLLGLQVNWEKSKLMPTQRICFLGMELEPKSTPHPGTCSVGAELLQDFIRQDGGSTETLSEALGSYGCSCGDSSARSAPYETASALAPWPNPEVGVETRYSTGSDYTGLPQKLQPEGWSDLSFLRAGVPLE